MCRWGLLYVVVRPFVGTSRRLLGSGLLLYSFGHYVVSVNPTSEAPAILMTIALVGLWTRALGWRPSAPGWGTFAALGAVGGLLILTRAEGRSAGGADGADRTGAGTRLPGVTVGSAGA